MQLVADGRRVIKDYHAVRGQLHKTRDRYYACCAEWETCLNMLHREYGMQWSPTAGNKLYEKEQQVSRKVDEVWDRMVCVIYTFCYIGSKKIKYFPRIFQISELI